MYVGRPMTARRGKKNSRPSFPRTCAGSMLEKCSILSPGQVFSGFQTVKTRDTWNVNVIIQSCDFDTGYICGTMEAMNVPQEKTSVLTFWEGEVIDDMSKFWTKQWNASGKTDLEHWSRFPSFEPLKPLLQRSLVEANLSRTGSAMASSSAIYAQPVTQPHSILNLRNRANAALPASRPFSHTTVSSSTTSRPTVSSSSLREPVSGSSSSQVHQRLNAAFRGERISQYLAHIDNLHPRESYTSRLFRLISPGQLGPESWEDLEPLLRGSSSAPSSSSTMDLEDMDLSGSPPQGNESGSETPTTPSVSHPTSRVSREDTPAFVGKLLAACPHVFMRWKEKMFIKEGGESRITIAGFYYICFDRVEGTIDGFYYDPLSTPFQRLRLKWCNQGLQGHSFANFELQ